MSVQTAKSINHANPARTAIAVLMAGMLVGFGLLNLARTTREAATASAPALSDVNNL